MRILSLFLVVALVVAACGDDSSNVPGAADTTIMDGGMGGDHMGETDMGGMNMGDANATAAYDVSDAELMSATFALLETRPPGYDTTAGEAWLARHDAGTTVTIRLSGLVADTRYIAHVHEGSCADLGGDHFKFDRDGSDMPPNEIHLAFNADADGSGFMTAENEAVAGETARSVVVHPVDLLDNKLACAEF